jgi:hypothetical protein
LSSFSNRCVMYASVRGFSNSARSVAKIRGRRP